MFVNDNFALRHRQTSKPKKKPDKKPKEETKVSTVEQPLSEIQLLQKALSALEIKVTNIDSAFQQLQLESSTVKTRVQDTILLARSHQDRLDTLAKEGGNNSLASIQDALDSLEKALVSPSAVVLKDCDLYSAPDRECQVTEESCATLLSGEKVRIILPLYRQGGEEAQIDDDNLDVWACVRLLCPNYDVVDRWALIWDGSSKQANLGQLIL